MKKIYDKNLIELYMDKNPSYNELLKFLADGDFEQKHFALTFIDSLKNPEDIKLFINNLVDNDTKIRELASFRTNDFILENNNLMSFLDENSEIILRTIDDVNPQVCRNSCFLLNLSKNKTYLGEKILNKLEILTEKTRTIRFKTHKTSKDIFNLYWNFFAIENLIDQNFEHAPKLKQILELTAIYKDYTIRERTAFLTKKLLSSGFAEINPIFEQLKNDDNFYVCKALF